CAAPNIAMLTALSGRPLHRSVVLKPSRRPTPPIPHELKPSPPPSCSIPPRHQEPRRHRRPGHRADPGEEQAQSVPEALVGRGGALLHAISLLQRCPRIVLPLHQCPHTTLLPAVATYSLLPPPAISHGELTPPPLSLSLSLSHSLT
uniref:Uncharacterized protein n=2 Tax=Aegilops tauschii subsp. strangulata TaxID=200361 RepID=A0A453LEN3_AEGTS